MNSNLISVPPSGQSSIQIMTIKSQQGHAVQIPVDVQAASKIADEKRRRNADASARFRARRKEKEREASMSISRLEQQVRDAIDSADFYRTERDYFRSLVYRQPRAERHYVRPLSPILRRFPSAPSYAPSSLNNSGSDDSYQDFEKDNRESIHNVRRCTSGYQPVPGPPPAETNVLPFASHGYTSSQDSSNSTPAVIPARGQRYAPNEQENMPALQQTIMEQPRYRDSFA
jgi:hypothetical protein